MPRYRIRASRFHGCIIQQKCWWGWKTVVDDIGSPEQALLVIRELQKVHEALGE